MSTSISDKSFVSIDGEAELVESLAKLQQFWSPAYEELVEPHMMIRTSFSSR